MGAGDGLARRAALPAEGLTFEVPCRSSASGPERPHPVTLTPDWRLHTPHDLDAERVAVALGGVCPCVELADRTLPAVRGYLTHRLRLEPAAIAHAGGGSWLLTVDAVGCCGEQGFPQARDAAAHLRRPLHWARRYGATQAAIVAFAQRVLDAIAVAWADPGIADQTVEPRCPAVPDAERPDLADANALTVLWDAGLHPVDVGAIVRELAPGGAPVATRAVLERAYAALPGSSASGAGKAEAGSGSAPGAGHRGGRRRPDERGAWVREGVPLAAVTEIMSQDVYSLNDARILANRLSRSVAEAATLLARWQANGLTPPVDTLVGLYWGPMLMDAPPPKALVDRTLALARAEGVRATRVDAALALIRTGTAAGAVTMLADPNRRPDDPYSP